MFPWLTANLTGRQAAKRVQAAQREIRQRAALLYRLGFSSQQATARIAGLVAWEFDPPSAHHGHHRRPADLDDKSIAALVAETYARRPA